MGLTVEQRTEMVKRAIMCQKPERVPVVSKQEPLMPLSMPVMI